MSENPHTGSCTCGDCSVSIVLPEPLSSYTPRACDCGFCVPRGVAYLSAPQARISLRSVSGWRRDQQGSRQAFFLSCTLCGELLAVVAELEDGWRGAVNARQLEDRELLREAQPASPKGLDGSGKRARWGSLWGRVEMEAVLDRLEQRG
ncbi:MAG: aldehyde-activating protein [Pseudomonadota bacterium]